MATHVQMTAEEKVKSDADDAAAAATAPRKLKHSETMATFKLDRRFNEKKVLEIVNITICT